MSGHAPHCSYAIARKLRGIFAVGAFTLLASGCISFAPAPEDPASLSDLPERYSAEEIVDPYTPASWWTAFDDPVLDELIAKALESNLDIAEAMARLEQAKAQARISRAALLPAVSASGSGNSTSSPVDGLAFGNLTGGAVDRIENESYTLSLGASYELDLFGRARDDFRAANRDALASAYDLKTSRLSVAAETLTAYFDLVDARRQIELTQQITALLEERTLRTEERFERGIAESFELYQVRQDLRSNQASLPQLQTAAKGHEARLALLLGVYPEALQEPLSAPLRPRLVFEDVPTGLPSDLLNQRPDVAAAWARLEAARLRIGARKAERFPGLSLTASYGTQSGKPGGAFDFANNWTNAFAASIVAPILDGGRISAGIRNARAVYDQRAAAYVKTVLTAYSEVDRAIADYEVQRERYLLISAQLAEAEKSLDLQRRRFVAGVGSYLSYLDALRAFYQTQASLSSAARATALARLGIHRALGGDWDMRETSSGPESEQGEPL